MSRKIPWNRLVATRELMIWSSVLFLAFHFLGKKVLTPANAALKEVQGQAVAKRMELKALQDFKGGALKGPPASARGAARNRLEILGKVQEAFGRAKTVPEVATSEFLMALTQPQFSKAATLAKFSYLGEKKQPGYTELNLDFKLVGSFDGISRFFRLMGKIPFLFRTQAVGLQPIGEKDPGTVQLVAKAVLYVPDPKAGPTQAAAGLDRAELGADLLRDRPPPRDLAPFQAPSRDRNHWSLQELQLTATMAGGRKPSALINGTLFALGDVVSDFKLAEIRPQEVILQRGDVTHALRIVQTFQEDGAAPPEPPAVPAAVVQAVESLRTGSRAPDPEDEAVAEGEAEPEPGKMGGGGEAPPEDPAPDARYTANEYGILGARGEKPAVPPARALADAPAAEAPPDTARNPYQVEDIEQVPFEDLKDPLEVANHSKGPAL